MAWLPALTTVSAGARTLSLSLARALSLSHTNTNTHTHTHIQISLSLTHTHTRREREREREIHVIARTHNVCERETPNTSIAYPCMHICRPCRPCTRSARPQGRASVAVAHYFPHRHPMLIGLFCHIPRSLLILHTLQTSDAWRLVSLARTQCRARTPGPRTHEREEWGYQATGAARKCMRGDVCRLSRPGLVPPTAFLTGHMCVCVCVC